MDSKIRLERNALFQELKPFCVAVSQLALRGDGSQSSTNALVASTTKLHVFLDQKCRRTDGAFDQKLADYVFFPLSQILQKQQQHTDQLSELTLRCVNILLEFGWRTIELDLGRQLLILFTFVAGGVPGKSRTHAPEEIVSVAFRGVDLLLRNIGRTPGGSGALVDSGTLPALGHSVTVILEGVTTGPSTDVQVHALGALNAVWHCVKDAEALAEFLPGTISGLTKCLVPTTTAKRTKKTLVEALCVLEHVLISILGDLPTRNIRIQTQPSGKVGSSDKDLEVLSPSWLKATAVQIKLALSNVMLLRKHDSEDVRTSLNQLCLRLLDECHETLVDSASILVETSMTLRESSPRSKGTARKTSLIDLAMIYPDITAHIKSAVYDWVTRLPRIMQSNSESAKISALDQLSGAYNLFTELDLESSVLEDSLASALRDSVIFTLDATATPKYVEENVFNPASQAALSLIMNTSSTAMFRPIILAEQSDRLILKHFKDMLSNIGNHNIRLNLVKAMLQFKRGGSSGSGLLSSFWLSVELMQSATRLTEGLDDFLDTSLTTSSTQSALEEELYSNALEALVEPGEERDWRIQAVAVEVVAYAAQRQKQEFRVNLIDALYPITQLLGSSQPLLRDHAVTCLNIVANACEYKDASTMIIDNADYMVNAISLRLNTFDISPAAPQVLVMMIRLAGPSILLYLDDVVGSIFAALENFHGYPMLVESLFSVLAEIVSVGARSDLLEIEHTPPISQFENRPNSPSIEHIVSLLVSKPKESEFGNVLAHKDFPRAPWKSAKALLDDMTPPEPPNEDDEQALPEDNPTSEEIVIPPTKTHTLIRRITHQTQHHLTSSSPHLRTHLLNLVKTSTLALPSSSVDFLPLINDIWPTVLARLYDTEPYVSIAAAEALSAICKSSGDFLNTRFATEWSAITKFAKARKSDAAREKKGKSGRGMFSMASKVWAAIIVLLGDVVGWVGVSDAMFDDVLEIIGPDILKERADLVELLSGAKGNADAVWLAMEIATGGQDRCRMPVLDGFKYAEFPRGMKA